MSRNLRCGLFQISRTTFMGTIYSDGGMSLYPGFIGAG